MRYVSYLRTSTKEQTLGIEAQRDAVARFTADVIEEFVEHESGKRHENRPELAKAMALCKKQKLTLCIAKLDRLARNVHFITGLIESGVDFVCCDNPHATKTMLQMMAVFAEHERDLIAQRTKDGLAAAARNGVVLGKYAKGLTDKDPMVAVRKGVAARCAKVAAADRNLLPIVEKVRSQGAKTYREIAAELNERGIKSPRGGEWRDTSVRNLIMRAA